MSNKNMYCEDINRGCGSGGCGCGGCGGPFGFLGCLELEEWLLPILVIFLLFSAGGGIFDFLFCEENAIIWIILIVLLLGIID